MSDPIWDSIRSSAERDAAAEPALERFFARRVLDHTTLERALASGLAEKLETETLHARTLEDVLSSTLAARPAVRAALRADLAAVVERNPACDGPAEPFLFFKGYHGLQIHRVSHALWGEGRRAMALHLQSRASEVFGMDIHPAARIGRGVFIDHGTSIVIGETAVIDDDVSMLHEVTLGGTGKEHGDRHPKIRRGVLISAGAKILGNIVVGEGAKIGGGSVVLNDVPPHSTVVGVPGRVVGTPGSDAPALEMDQSLGYDI